MEINNLNSNQLIFLMIELNIKELGAKKIRKFIIK
jgi:hypothetical protein